MIRFGILASVGLGVLGCVLTCPAVAAAASGTSTGAPDFREVYDLVKQNLSAVTSQDLDKAAVQGLIAQLKPRVSLITNNATQTSATNTPLILKTNSFDGPIAYARIGRVADGLANEIRQAYSAMNKEAKLKGLVLDLRFCNGEDYAAAAAVADLFARKRQQLLKWGSGSAQSTEKNDSISGPVAVVVNHDTGAAAEALAAVLRQIGIGLIIGNRTAGEAMVARDFPLSNGDKLRIAVARIEVGDTSTISPEGVKPDIAVDVPAEDERAYYADAFKVLERPNLVASTTLSLTNQANGTNRPGRRPRFNEAELVRERREGVTLDLDAASGKEETEAPIVHDPVLARALDLLKGLAVVRHGS